MPTQRALNPLLLLLFTYLCSASWAQSSSAPSATDPQAQPAQTTQTPADSTNTPSPDQPSAASPADSTKLEAIKTQKAIYPLEARQQKIQGRVMVKILVSETGDVESAEAVSGNPMLTHSAVDAIKKWKFKPFIKNGKPAKVSATLPIDFSFGDKIMQNGVSADRSTISDPHAAAQTPSGSPSATDSPPDSVNVSSGISQGLLIRQVAPVYPEAARIAGIEGSVLLQVLIDKEGRVADVKLLSGPKELADAAIGAVQQWRYRPYLFKGQPVKVRTQILVKFRQ
jgi:TonB family protein